MEEEAAGNMCKLPKRMAGCVGGYNARNIALVDVNEFGVGHQP